MMAGDDVGFAQKADSSMTGWLKSMGHQYPVNKAASEGFCFCISPSVFCQVAVGNGAVQ